MLTMEVYASVLPRGVVNFISGSGRTTMPLTTDPTPTPTPNFISGSGRTTMPPVMRSGLVDVLGFIGGSRASDALIKEHPAPHRLRSFLQVRVRVRVRVIPPAAPVGRALTLTPNP